jgi:hypothetical protein
MNYPQPKRVSGVMGAEFGPPGRGLGGWGADIHSPSSGTRYDVDDLAWAQVVFEGAPCYSSRLPGQPTTRKIL